MINGIQHVFFPGSKLCEFPIGIIGVKDMIIFNQGAAIRYNDVFSGFGPINGNVK